MRLGAGDFIGRTLFTGPVVPFKGPGRFPNVQGQDSPSPTASCFPHPIPADQGHLEVRTCQKSAPAQLEKVEKGLRASTIRKLGGGGEGGNCNLDQLLQRKALPSARPADGAQSQDPPD